MRSMLILALLAGIAALGCAAHAGHPAKGSAANIPAEQANGVPAPLLAKFTRGVNITRWFCYLGGPGTPEHFENYWLADDTAQMKRLGIGFVRLCLSPDVVYRPGGEPAATAMPYVDKALDKLEEANLAILFDLHDNGQLKLDTSKENHDGFVAFWEEIARRYKGRKYDSLVFELVNEPVFDKNPQEWFALQERTVRAIRAIDPKRTIMVSGTGWSGIDKLAELPLLNARNLIYTFHCYDPFWFTHQGATWSGEGPKVMKNIPFPSSPENVAPLLDDLPMPYRDWIRDYGEKRYDASYLRNRLAQAHKYGVTNRVPVILGEFGAYPPVSPPDSRARWFAAMRTAIDQLGLPAAIWGYDDGLGLGRKVENNRVQLDGLTLEHFYRLKD